MNAGGHYVGPCLCVTAGLDVDRTADGFWTPPAAFCLSFLRFFEFAWTSPDNTKLQIVGGGLSTTSSRKLLLSMISRLGPTASTPTRQRHI